MTNSTQYVMWRKRPQFGTAKNTGSGNTKQNAD